MSSNQEDCNCPKGNTEIQTTILTRLIGKVFVDDDEKQRRMDICKKCEHFSDMLHQCELCGCFLEAKTRIKAFHCALDQIGKEPLW
jgi:Family of unknown function (DUF6171)